MNDNVLKNKTAVVTGAASGLGLAIARGLVDSGANVAVVDANEENLKSVYDRYFQGKKNIRILTDVSNESQVDHMTETVIRELGSIDVLVCGAGITVRKPTMEINLEEFEKVISVNLTGTFLCCKSVARHMLGQGSGSIINIASIMGHVSFPGRPAYDASKGGVVQLTKTMALEWAEQGIRVNALCPGFAKTELTRKLWESKETLELITSLTPMKRMAEPEEMIGAVVFLASDNSKFVTGSSLFVDGGWMAW